MKPDMYHQLISPNKDLRNNGKHNLQIMLDEFNNCLVHLKKLLFYHNLTSRLN